MAKRFLLVLVVVFNTIAAYSQSNNNLVQMLDGETGVGFTTPLGGRPKK